MNTCRKMIRERVHLVFVFSWMSLEGILSCFICIGHEDLFSTLGFRYVIRRAQMPGSLIYVIFYVEFVCSVLTITALAVDTAACPGSEEGGPIKSDIDIDISPTSNAASSNVGKVTLKAVGKPDVRPVADRVGDASCFVAVETTAIVACFVGGAGID